MDAQRPLTGQTVLVTGAGKRLGRACAVALARAGCNVVLHYHTSAAEASETAGQISKFGARVWQVQADLASADDLADLFARAVQAAGAIDILVNSASIFPEDTLHSATMATIVENIHMNAYVPLVLSRAMAGQGRQGCIVNLLDTRILDYDRNHFSYHLSKRMLHAITRMAALEFAPRVRVNAVAPGLVLPPQGKDAAYLQSLAHTNPMQAVGAPEDVAEAVVFLAQARFTTGQIVYIDGGRHMLGGVYA